MSILLTVLFSWSFVLGYFFQAYFITTSFLFLACPAWFALQEKGAATLIEVLFQEAAVFSGALMSYFFVRVHRIKPFWMHSHWPGLISSVTFSLLLIGTTLGWHFWRRQEWSFLPISGIALFLTFLSFMFAPYDSFRLGPGGTRGNNHFWLAVGVVTPIMVTGTLAWATQGKYTDSQLFHFVVSLCVLAGITQMYNLVCNVLFKRLYVRSKAEHHDHEHDDEEITFDDVIGLLADVRTRAVKFVPQWHFSIDQVD